MSSENVGVLDAGLRWSELLLMGWAPESMTIPSLRLILVVLVVLIIPVSLSTILILIALIDIVLILLVSI